MELLFEERGLRMKRWNLIVVVFTVVLCAGQTPALAQLDRKQEKIKIRGRHEVRSKDAVKRATESKKIRAEDFMIAQIKARVTSIIQQQMKLLERRLRVTPEDDPRAPEYLFRLASLRNEMQNDQWIQGMALNEKIFQAEERKNKAEVQRLRGLQKRYFKAHHAWLRSALMTFREITEKHPKYPRMDEVYFHISNTATRLIEREEDEGRKKGWTTVMLTYFRKLLQQFPESQYVPDALLAYAEHSYDNREFSAALKLYQRITEYKDSPVRPYAIYKIGWVYLNLRQYRQAMNQFLMTLRLPGIKDNLRNEARRDIVRTFTHVGKVEEARGFFRKVAGEENVKWMMVMLGDVYYSQGKNEEAIHIYDECLRTWPRDEDRCKWTLALVDAAINLGDKDGQVNAIRRLGKIWRSVAEQFGPKKSVTRECRENSANIMKMLATQWHNEAQTTRNYETLDKAQYLYETFISSFPENPDIYIMRFYYADLLFMLGETIPERANWPRTAEAFNAVVQTPRPPKMPKKEYVERRNSAALAMVNSWMQHFNVTAERLTQKPRELEKAQKKCVKRKGRKCIEWAEQEMQKLPIPADRQRMLEAFRTYAEFVPDSEWLVRIKFNEALIYYNYNHLDEALPRFMDIATKHQEDEEPARHAALRVVAILQHRNEFAKLAEYIDKFLASEKLMADMSFALQMQEYKRNAMWEEAEELRKRKQFKECGEAFELIARTFPKDTRIDDIYWNAGICYEAARLIGAAVRMRRALRKTKPDSKLAGKALYYIGGNYHALAFYEDAAENYEQFYRESAKKNINLDDASTALKFAILFRWGTGDTKRMMDNVRSFIETFGKHRKYSSEVAEVHFWVHRVYEDEGTRDAENRLVSHLTQYLSRYRVQGGLDRQIEATAKLGRIFWRRSCRVDMVDGMCVQIRYERGRRRKKLARKQRRLVYIERDRRLRANAMSRFRSVLSLWGKKGPGKRMAGKTPEEREARTAAALYWVAMSQFMLVDADFEEYMKLDMPSNLNFDPRNMRRMQADQKRFGKWAESKAKSLESLRERYMQVILLRQAHWAIAATARIGMLFHNFARQLYDAPVPSHLRTEEEQHAYRDELQKYADPLQARAMDGYVLCLNTAKKYNWFNEWSHMCEREINELAPEQFPLTMELRAQPGYVSTELTPGAVVTQVQ